VRENPQWIIFGAGGHGKVILDILQELDGSREVILLDDNPTPPVQKPPLVLPELPVFHGVGDLQVRRELQTQRYPTANWALVVANTAHVARPAWIYLGAQILNYAYVGPDTIIHDGCIINNHASVDHDCDVGAFCHIAPGAVLCGNVLVGKNTLIGAGSVVIPGVHIGVNCVIAAGSKVLHDIPSNSVLTATGDMRPRQSKERA